MRPRLFRNVPRLRTSLLKTAIRNLLSGKFPKENFALLCFCLKDVSLAGLFPNAELKYKIWKKKLFLKKFVGFLKSSFLLCLFVMQSIKYKCTMWEMGGTEILPLVFTWQSVFSSPNGKGVGGSSSTCRQSNFQTFTNSGLGFFGFGFFGSGEVSEFSKGRWHSEDGIPISGSTICKKKNCLRAKSNFK